MGPGLPHTPAFCSAPCISRRLQGEKWGFLKAIPIKMSPNCTFEVTTKNECEGLRDQPHLSLSRSIHRSPNPPQSLGLVITGTAQSHTPSAQSSSSTQNSQVLLCSLLTGPRLTKARSSSSRHPGLSGENGGERLPATGTEPHSQCMQDFAVPRSTMSPIRGQPLVALAKQSPRPQPAPPAHPSPNHSQVPPDLLRSGVAWRALPNSGRCSRVQHSTSSWGTRQ